MTRPADTPTALPRDALAFQDDIDALVAEPAPLFLRYWPALAAALLGGLLTLAALMRIDQVVVATGRLATDAPVVVLAPLDRAILRDVRVQPGDLVQQGQVVAVLDATFPEADRDALLAEHRAALAENARLEAELAGQPLAVMNAETGLQAQVQSERARMRAAQRAALEADLAALTSALASEGEAASGLDGRVAISRDIEDMRAQLVDRQAGAQLSLLLARADRIDSEDAVRRHRAEMDELAQRIEAARAQIEAFDHDGQRQILQELAQVRPALQLLEERLAKAERLATLTTLIAPRPAVVLSVATAAPGSLMREGEAVVVLVPTDVPVIAEVGIRSSDVGRLAAGDPVTLKIDAFPWRRFGTLQGTLRSIGQASFAPQDQTSSGAPPPGTEPGTALHRGQITLDPAALAALPPGTALLPGMTLSADIKIGTRSVLDFFIDPLLRGLQESLREP